MRRFFAAILVALFVIQYTGAADAAPAIAGQQPPPLLAEIHSALSRLLNGFQTTQIGTSFAGTERLWQLEHAAGPAPIARPPMMSPYATRNIQHLNARPAGYGALSYIPMASPKSLYVKHIDPFVTRSAGKGTKPMLCPQSARHFALVYSSDRTPQLICCNAGCSTPKPTIKPSPTPAPTPTPTPVPTPTPTPVPTPTPTPVPTATPTPTPLPTLSPGNTGIKPWWSFKSTAIPGLGAAAVNVLNGNLLISVNDLQIAERGVDFSFTRFYNSQSAHDNTNSDGSVASNYGNGWTNTFDAHLGYNTATNVLSVYDGTGAKYDYTSNGQNGWIAPPGQYATLVYDGQCGYYWTQTDGTIFQFYLPDLSVTGCGVLSAQGQAGRLYMVYGRNHNNWVRFDYYFDNNNKSSAAYLNKINAVHADGQVLTLNFADFGTHRELSNIVRPDNQAVSFVYDSLGNLTDVCEIGNNTAQPAGDATCNWSSPHLHHQYAYNAGTHQVAWTNSPRWVMSGYTFGTYQNYYYDGSNRVSSITDNGTVNFAPADGTSALLNPSASSGVTQYLVENFSGYASGTTSFSDSYGHASTWSFDTGGRVYQEQTATGETSPKPTWLITSLTWDPSNNLTRFVDPRGNATDVAYDPFGNPVEIAQAAPSAGAFRPTTLISYDYNTATNTSNNNVTAVCDPAETHSLGADWTAPPTATGATLESLCPSQNGASRYVYSTAGGATDANEPYGRLTQMYTPLGYEYIVSYNTTSQAGNDYGLVSDISGATPITQQDTSARTPHVSAVYDAYGNGVCIAPWQDSGGAHYSRVFYDGLNRPIISADADDASLTVPQCTNSAGLPQSYIRYTRTYYNDGEISSTQSPSEYAKGVSTSYSYDADGNLTSETDHFGSTYAGVTSRWYDAADRLVEVSLPSDPNDIFSTWLTRYIYDNGNATSAYFGNLYKTQRYVPGITQTGTTVSNPYQWLDVKSWTYDAVDRVVHRSYYSPGATVANTDVWDWDNGPVGFLSDYTNGAGDSVTFSYDALGNATRRSFNSNSGLFVGALPSEEMTYDADSRLASFNNDETGTSFLSYDADGNVSSYSEPNGAATWSRPSALGTVGPINSPHSFSYTYYGDDLLSEVTYNNSGWYQQYSYRGDGLLQAQTSYASWAWRDQFGSWRCCMYDNYTWTQSFTNAGRLTGKSDAVQNPTNVPFSASRRPMSLRVMGTRRMLSGGTNALTVGYDGNGQLNSWAIPSGTYSNFSYDPEGEVTGFTTSIGPQQWQLSYSTRGELLQEGLASVPAPAPIANFRSAAGFLYSMQTVCNTDRYGNDWCGVPTLTFDTRNDGVVSSKEQVTGTLYSTTTYSYDGAGRRTGSRQYDALNRLLKASYAYSHGLGTIPFNIGGFTNHASLGQMLATTTDSSGNLRDVKLGMNSEIVPMDSTFNGLTVYDRDPFGYVAAQRNTSGTSAWTFPNLFSVCDGTDSGNLGAATTGFTGTALANCNPAGMLYAYRSDGYFDGSLTVRGVRTYDADTQQWSTPDAWQGDATEPISGLTYNYANNNPAVFADPSGFCPGSPTNAQLDNDPSCTIAHLYSSPDGYDPPYGGSSGGGGGGGGCGGGGGGVGGRAMLSVAVMSGGGAGCASKPGNPKNTWKPPTPLQEQCAEGKITCVGPSWYKANVKDCTEINNGMHTGGRWTPEEDRPFQNGIVDRPDEPSKNSGFNLTSGISGALSGISDAAIRLNNTLDVIYFNKHCKK